MNSRTGNRSGYKKRDEHGRYKKERESESDYDDYSNDYRNEYDSYEDDDDDFWDEYSSYDDEEKYDDDGYHAGSGRLGAGHGNGRIVRSRGRFARRGDLDSRGGDNARGEGLSYYRSYDSMPGIRDEERAWHHDPERYFNALQEWEIGGRINSRWRHRGNPSDPNPEFENPFDEKENRRIRTHQDDTENLWEREEDRQERLRGVARWRNSRFSPYQNRDEYPDEDPRNRANSFDTPENRVSDHNFHARIPYLKDHRKRHSRAYYNYNY